MVKIGGKSIYLFLLVIFWMYHKSGVKCVINLVLWGFLGLEMGGFCAQNGQNMVDICGKIGGKSI